MTRCKYESSAVCRPDSTAYVDSSTADRPFLYAKFNLQILSRVHICYLQAHLGLISRWSLLPAKDDTLCIKPQQQPPEFNLSSFASSSRSDRLIIASLMGEQVHSLYSRALKLFPWIAAAAGRMGMGHAAACPACALKFFWPRNLGTGGPRPCSRISQVSPPHPTRRSAP